MRHADLLVELALGWRLGVHDRKHAVLLRLGQLDAVQERHTRPRHALPAHARSAVVAPAVLARAMLHRHLTTFARPGLRRHLLCG
jgi:hypothetical protein